MKTSDKILIGLIVILFTVPFLFAYTIKTKIKKGEYTIEKSEKIKNVDYYSGTFTAFKVVKVIGPGPNNLRCRFKLSGDMKYEYNNYWKEKIQVFNSNDTLVIRYQPSGKELHDQLVNIKLPTFNTLIVDGASVVLDSVGTNSNLNVTLKNGGTLSDGTERRFDGAKAKKATVPIKPVPASAKPEQLEAANIKEADVNLDPGLDLGLDLRGMILYRL